MTPLTRESIGAAFVGTTWSSCAGTIAPMLFVLRFSEEALRLEDIVMIFCIMIPVSFLLMIPIACLAGYALVPRLATRYPNQLPTYLSGAGCLIGIITAPLCAYIFTPGAHGIWNTALFLRENGHPAVTIFQLAIFLGAPYGTLTGLITGLYLRNSLQSHPTLQNSNTPPAATAASTSSTPPAQTAPTRRRAPDDPAP